MEDIRISLVQADLAWENPEANFKHFNELLNPLAGQTDLIILPEMFNTGFSVEPAKIAETMEGPAVRYLKEKANELQAVIMASIIIHEDEKYYNRLIWAEPSGDIQSYDKKHLFRMGGEHHRFEAGKETLITELKGWKIMPLVCYDLRFPGWARNEYQDGSFRYDLLIYIANWPKARSMPWSTLLKARAIENQSVVAGVNRIGIDGKGLAYSGNSALIDAKGIDISAIEPSTEMVKTITLSAKELSEFRNKFQLGLDWDCLKIED